MIPNRYTVLPIREDHPRESAFWQRQRETIHGRIEPAPVQPGTSTWRWVALCVCIVCLIAIVRGVSS